MNVLFGELGAWDTSALGVQRHARGQVDWGGLCRHTAAGYVGPNYEEVSSPAGYGLDILRFTIRVVMRTDSSCLTTLSCAKWLRDVGFWYMSARLIIHDRQLAVRPRSQRICLK